MCYRGGIQNPCHVLKIQIEWLSKHQITPVRFSTQHKLNIHPPLTHTKTPRWSNLVTQLIRLQVQTADNKLFHGPIDCIKKMYGAGGIQGIYRGIMPTLVRESHGMGMYFLTFEALVKREMALKDCQRKDIPGWKLCMYGAGAGYGMWTTAYPIDVIKSKMQTDSIFPAERKYKNSFDCAKQIMREQGVKGFFRGFGPTMLRAAPVNACTFYAFELACRAMG